MIVIIDYGMGNLRSVQKSINRLNTEAKISSDLKEIENADKIILPGVGHFLEGMTKLKASNTDKLLKSIAAVGEKPILGICLGMQLLTNYSEEGNVEGLGLIDAVTTKFNNVGFAEKIPHMGWNNIKVKKECALTIGLTEEDYFYFVHSYFVKCKNEEDVLVETEYIHKFHSGFHKNNLYGVQFHPEKSYESGFTLLKNFINI